MARKIKEPVTLRRRSLRNGNVSLYLDIYIGGKRSYEYLRLYLIPERTKQDREQNKRTLDLALARKTRRLTEVQEGTFGSSSNGASDLLFLDYMRELGHSRNAPSTCRLWGNVVSCLSEMPEMGSLRLADMRSDVVLRIREWLLTGAVNRTYKVMDDGVSKGDGKFGGPRLLSRNTAWVYFSKVKCALNTAFRNGLVDFNDAAMVEGIRKQDPEKSYLTLVELRELWKCEGIDPKVRDAFVFSCLTGLRFSDIGTIRFDSVEEVGSRKRLRFRQTKTKGQQYLYLSLQAVEIVSRQTDRGDGLIFGSLGYPWVVNYKLRKWAEAAGIKKRISFHTGRHTFAVLMLEQGVDIYTVSKLMGHTDVKTTQVYARIVDRRRLDAVDSIPEIF